MNLLTDHLTSDQTYLIGELLAMLEPALDLGAITRAEAALALERVAADLRAGGRCHTFSLPPQFKPYVRMTQRSMHVDVHAQQYLASKIEIGHRLKQQLRGRPCPLLPASTPLVAHLELPHADHRRDLDNEIKAALDAANGILYPDDRWIDAVVATRGQTPAADSRLTVGVLARERAQ